MSESKGLLVLRYPMPLTSDQIDALTQAIDPTAEALGVEPLVLGSGADARLEYGASALLERVCVALEALVRQGEPPEVSDAQNAPQALNARRTETGLNSRPTPFEDLHQHTDAVVEHTKRNGLPNHPDPFRYDSDKHHG